MEHTALSVRPVLGPDTTTVHLCDTLANGQTESETIYLPCESCVYTMKAVEDTFKMFERYTHASIAHENLQHSPGNTR
jgi:hypothetical protein